MLGAKSLDDPFHDLHTFFDMGHLAAAKKNGHLHFVFVIQETNCFFDFKVDVVFARFWSQANFFQFRLMSFVLAGAFAFFVSEFAVIHDAANRRSGIRRDFYQIKSQFLRLCQSVFRFQNSKLVTFCSDYPNGCNSNLIVNTILSSIDFVRPLYY